MNRQIEYLVIISLVDVRLVGTAAGSIGVVGFRWRLLCRDSQFYRQRFLASLVVFFFSWFGVR
jgi:hypothetical protein